MTHLFDHGISTMIKRARRGGTFCFDTYQNKEIDMHRLLCAHIVREGGTSPHPLISHLQDFWKFGSFVAGFVPRTRDAHVCLGGCPGCITRVTPTTSFQTSNLTIFYYYYRPTNVVSQRLQPLKIFGSFAPPSFQTGLPTFQKTAHPSKNLAANLDRRSSWSVYVSTAQRMNPASSRSLEGSSRSLEPSWNSYTHQASKNLGPRAFYFQVSTPRTYR